jgi:hypothetical protein
MSKETLTAVNGPPLVLVRTGRPGSISEMAMFHQVRRVPSGCPLGLLPVCRTIAVATALIDEQ